MIIGEVLYTKSAGPVSFEPARRALSNGCHRATLLHCIGQARRLRINVDDSCVISWELTEDCQAIRNVVISFKTVPSGTLQLKSLVMH